MITLIVILIIAGIALYLVNRYLPMDLFFKRIVSILIIVALLLYLLSFIGVIHIK